MRYLMKRALTILAVIGLILTLLPSFLFFAGAMTHHALIVWMTAGMVLWFACRIPGIRTE
jgi:hypothetical protein